MIRTLGFIQSSVKQMAIVAGPLTSGIGVLDDISQHLEEETQNPPPTGGCIILL